MADQATVRWYYGVGGVLFLLALLGPLAFPFLWKSPRFSSRAKWTLTVAVVVLTIYVAVTSVHLFKILRMGIQFVNEP